MIPVIFNALSILTDYLNSKTIVNIFLRKKWKKAFDFWPVLNMKKGLIVSNFYDYLIYFKCKMQKLNSNFSNL